MCDGLTHGPITQLEEVTALEPVYVWIRIPLGLQKLNNMPSNYNHFCPYCLTSSKQNYKCGRCGQPTLVISHRAMVPKQNAKKKEWLALFKAIPHILMIAPKTKALTKLGVK